MAVQNGTDVLLEVGGVIVNATTNHDLNLSVDMIDVTTKDSSGSKEYIAGEDDATITIEGLYDPAATYSWSNLFAAITGKASATLTFGLQGSGDTAYRFAGFVMNLTLSGAKNEAGTFTAEFQKTGGIAEVTIT